MSTYDLRAPGYSDRDLEASVGAILDRAAVGAVATVAADIGAPHVSPVQVARAAGFELVFASDEGRQIGRNLGRDDRTALTLWDTDSERAGRRRALQLFGTARELEGDEARRALDLLQPRTAVPLHGRNTPIALFGFRVASARLVDEDRFACGHAVPVYVDRGRQWSETLVPAVAGPGTVGASDSWY